VKKVKRPVRDGGARPSSVGQPAATNRARPAKDNTGLAGEPSQSIQSFIDLLKQHNLAELEFEREGFRIRLKRESAAGSPLVAKPDHMPAGTPPQTDSQAAAVSEPVNGMVTITSPIVGTFYRSPSPDADPYVEEGDVVKKGQVLCIVEAMKLMNEIESEVVGRVVKILAESTKSVEYGQPLFLIDPSSAS
jgi:acetyl-CoA carboxylase biotin carboxyl carrier protein